MSMNRKMYELTYILTPVLSADQTAEVVARINVIIEGAGGTIIDVDQWGVQKLAYPVDKKRNGYYVNLYFEGPGTMIPRVERALTIDDNVLRSLILAMDKSMIAHYHANQSKKKNPFLQDTEQTTDG